MTESQLIEIRDYLLTRKLPIDILMEVEDHFILQIQKMMHEDNLSFQEALTRTHQIWQTDFKEYWNDDFNLEEKGYFIKNIALQIWVSTIKQSLLYFVFFCFFSGIIANIFSGTFFRSFIVFIMAFVAVFPALYYFIQYKNFKLLKKYDNFILSLYQMPLTIFIAMLGLLITYIPKTYERSDLLYSFLRFRTGWHNLEFVLGIAFIIISGIFWFISGKEFIKRIEKIKPSLKYLKYDS